MSIQNAIKFLTNAADELAKNDVTPPSADQRKAFDDVLDRLRSAARKVDLLGADADGIESFLESVGEGVVTAQRRLDRDSLAYMATRLPNAHASAFRIPKVTAELQFALEMTNSKKLNFVVFGAEASKKELTQNKVSFEIVSAPPPVELAGAMSSARGTDHLILFPKERRAAFELFDEHARAANVAPNVKKALEDWRKKLAGAAGRRVLLFRYVESEPDPASNASTRRGESRITAVSVTPKLPAAAAFFEIGFDAISIPAERTSDTGRLSADEVLGRSALGGAVDLRTREWFLGQVLLDLSDWQEAVLNSIGDELRLATP